MYVSTQFGCGCHVSRARIDFATGERRDLVIGITLCYEHAMTVNQDQNSQQAIEQILDIMQIPCKKE